MPNAEMNSNCCDSDHKPAGKEPDVEEGAAGTLDFSLQHPEEQLVKEMIQAWTDCQVVDNMCGIELSKAFANLHVEPM